MSNGKATVRAMGGLVLVAALASGCGAKQQRDEANPAEPEASDGSYTDPWGTIVAWNPVPAPSGGAVPSVEKSETDDAKPKEADDVVVTVTKEEAAPASTGSISGDDDDD